MSLGHRCVISSKRVITLSQRATIFWSARETCGAQSRAPRSEWVVVLRFVGSSSREVFPYALESAPASSSDGFLAGGRVFRFVPDERARATTTDRIASQLVWLSVCVCSVRCVVLLQKSLFSVRTYERTFSAVTDRRNPPPTYPPVATMARWRQQLSAW